MRVHVIVPAFNCHSALARCLGSLYVQDYPDLNIVVIDDASTDLRMASTIQQFCERQGWTAILNSENMQCPRNLCRGIEVAGPDPHDIIFILDGDDFLPAPDVISKVVAVYEASPETWLTYGAYTTVPVDPHTPQTGYYPLEVRLARGYRTHPLTMFNHPITFKHFLWAALDEKRDFQYPDGTWVVGVYDEAIMYPMLEMATNHHQCLSEILYVYNSDNPLSVWRSMPKEIARAGEYLRSLPSLPAMVLDGDRLIPEAVEQ